jgi:hypothetical protein
MCGYTAGASAQYLCWFALEAHADPGTVNRLCESAGMCAGHTRSLMSQPGAAGRLTPLYLSILQAVPARLGARRIRLAGCPACEHGQTVTGRAVDIVVDGLAERSRESVSHPGLSTLCLPHAHAVSLKACRRGSHRLAQFIVADTLRWPVSIEELTGGPDYDTDARAGLRARLPAPGESPPGACPVCLAGAHAELARLAATAGAGAAWVDGAGLCPGHLRDVAASYPGQTAPLVAEEFRRQAEALSKLTAAPRLRDRWGARKQCARATDGGPGMCFICDAREDAKQRMLVRYAATAGGERPDSVAAQRLCLRHALCLQESAPAAGHLAAAAANASLLCDELREAFDKNTWPRRHELRGPETTAWLRAAAFLDGQIFGGGPPPRLAGSFGTA